MYKISLKNLLFFTQNIMLLKMIFLPRYFNVVFLSTTVVAIQTKFLVDLPGNNVFHVIFVYF